MWQGILAVLGVGITAADSYLTYHEAEAAKQENIRRAFFVVGAILVAGYAISKAVKVR